MHQTRHCNDDRFRRRITLRENSRENTWGWSYSLSNFWKQEEREVKGHVARIGAYRYRVYVAQLVPYSKMLEKGNIMCILSVPKGSYFIYPLHPTWHTNSFEFVVTKRDDKGDWINVVGNVPLKFRRTFYFKFYFKWREFLLKERNLNLFFKKKYIILKLSVSNFTSLLSPLFQT